jgi:hypothetical protein
MKIKAVIATDWIGDWYTEEGAGLQWQNLWK